MNKNKKEQRFGTLPVFLTAISTILGAILFLRFGFAVGTLGFGGIVLIIIIGHLVTIPTALAISEIATNEKVKGGGEYFIISRSFGLNIGATIGIAFYLSQAISVAFYIIAFAEAFTPIFELIKSNFGLVLPKQVISVPALIILGVIIIKKGADVGVKLLYIVIAILFISLILFFFGTPISTPSEIGNIYDNFFNNSDKFFIVLAIVFPAFTGMTAGVGLSGDLKDPKKSIPLGTILGTVTGMIIYFFIAYKLRVSAPMNDLASDQFIINRITLFGSIAIPLGLAASTLSSAIGSILVAPRTLQALSLDSSFPSKRINKFLSKGIGSMNEPLNGTIVTGVIALVFVLMGDVDAVASVITMFFMVTYGSLCLISFLHHFGSDPSYRPTFQSKWYLSLFGALLAGWLMFQISSLYAIMAFVIIILIYKGINKYHRHRGGLESIFQGAIYQFNRKLKIYLQRAKKKDQGWRPSAICISKDTFTRNKSLSLLSWISYQYGFGTYIHLIDGYYSKETNIKAKEIFEKLVTKITSLSDDVYIDTLISPSFTSAIAQVVQLPSPSGMENNMVIFEFDKKETEGLEQILENISLVQSGSFDVCLLGSSSRNINYENGIDIWIKNWDTDNTNLMILLSYIILAHPVWKKAYIKIYRVCPEGKYEEEKENLNNLVSTGRLPISTKNIEVIELKKDIELKHLINQKSYDADLTILGFKEEIIHKEGVEFFKGYDEIGDVLFVDANGIKKI
ncbi:MAG: amino acid permease [Ignavibacteriales bacterium CG_4_9_14_3_um_filter_30_11]|nr:MAG: amino acid permease [Ignavibacteriales bacterium CG_4_9_14_3_um_filter_30_11]